MSDSVRPHRRQPTRLPRPWDSPGKNTGVGCHFLLQRMKVKLKVKTLSHVRLLATPWTAAHQAPPTMGLSRQEYWNGCHCLLRRHAAPPPIWCWQTERLCCARFPFTVPGVLTAGSTPGGHSRPHPAARCSTSGFFITSQQEMMRPLFPANSPTDGSLYPDKILHLTLRAQRCFLS